MNALNDKEFKEYWSESGTSSALIEHLRHYPAFEPTQYDGVEVSLIMFNATCEDARTPVPLLYQSGYLSIDPYDRKMNTYILHFPNYEVRQGMVGSMSNYLLDVNELEQDGTNVFVLELKVDDTVDNALAQIDDKGYAIPYETGLQPFKEERGRILTHSNTINYKGVVLPIHYT